jgi:hypothetical protein
VGIEQLATLLRENQAAVVSAKVDTLDEPLFVEMFECVAVGVEILFGHDAEGADGGQRTAVFAVQLVNAITIDNQLAFLSAR